MRHRRITTGIRRGRFHFQIGRFVSVVIGFLNVVLATAALAADTTAATAPVSKSVIDYWGDDPEEAAMADVAKSRAGTLPVLTTVDEVLRLKPAEAQRGYPVNLRGVVTCVVQ